MVLEGDLTISADVAQYATIAGIWTGITKFSPVSTEQDEQKSTSM